MDHRRCTAVANEPAADALQLPIDTAPSAVPAPSGHKLQTADPSVEKDPALHDSHCDGELSLLTFDAVPAGHLWHAAAPKIAKFPARRECPDVNKRAIPSRSCHELPRSCNGHFATGGSLPHSECLESRVG